MTHYPADWLWYYPPDDYDPPDLSADEYEAVGGVVFMTPEEALIYKQEMEEDTVPFEQPTERNNEMAKRTTDPRNEPRLAQEDNLTLTGDLAEGKNKRANRNTSENFNENIATYAHPDDPHLPDTPAEPRERSDIERTIDDAEQDDLTDANASMRDPKEIAQEMADTRRAIKSIENDLLRAKITLKHRPRDTKVRDQIEQLEDLLIDTETQLALLQDEHQLVLKQQQNKVILNLKQKLLEQARELGRDIVLPGDTTHTGLMIRYMYITGAAEKLQFRIVTGEDYFLYLQSRVQEDDQSALPDMTTVTQEEKDRYYEMQHERELMEVHMAYLRMEYDAIAHRVKSDTFKAPFLRQTDEQLKASLQQRQEEKAEQRRIESEQRKEAMREMNALDARVKIR